MTDRPSLKALAHRVLSRSKAGQRLGQEWGSTSGHLPQATEQVGQPHTAEIRRFEGLPQRPSTIGVGQRGKDDDERGSGWGNAGASSAVDAESGLPSAWIEGYQQLVIMRRPHAIPATTWTWMQAAAGELLTRWGRQLAAYGWTTIEVFGVHFEAPMPRVDCAGLLAMLSAHQKIEAISAKSVSLRTESGAVLRYYRPLASNPGIIPIWELTTGEPPRGEGRRG